jgi:6-pyruvoyltetrahydropterin/6-carboxytetrahydropterin synthase
MPLVYATRYHDISCGHCVTGHEGKCHGLHGHNYRVTFTCSIPELDSLGRVIDFSVVKSKLCLWLEDNWDHCFLVWEGDPRLEALTAIDPEQVVAVPFNPTAENIAIHLLNVVGPARLAGTGVTLTKVVVEETRKCSATAELFQCTW